LLFKELQKPIQVLTPKLRPIRSSSFHSLEEVGEERADGDEDIGVGVGGDDAKKVK
jgi:hypothetical protein